MPKIIFRIINKIIAIEAKIDKFINILIEQNGYIKVVEGLENTLKIAIVGLVIGIVIALPIVNALIVPNTSKLVIIFAKYEYIKRNN